MDGRTYAVGQSTITLQYGDITTSLAEAMVSSDDGDVSRGGGVSAAILRAAGGPSEAEIRKHVPAKVGEVVVTPADRLPARYILHAITLPSWQDGAPEYELPRGAIVRAAVQRIMELLILLRCRSVAFPSIGAGVAGISFEESAREMSEVIVRRLLDTPEPFQVELYLYDRLKQRSLDDLAALFESAIQSNLGIRSATRDGQTRLAAPTTEEQSDAGQPPSDEQRRQEVLSMLLHLGRQRDRLESDLLAVLEPAGTFPREQVASIRSSLEDIERLRAIYLNELGLGHELNPPVRPKTAFVSSTYSDLVPYRETTREVITALGWHYVGMEDFIPAGAPPGEYIRQRVKESQIYLGLLGMRYGSIDPSSGFSMTELEYHQAVASNKPRLMFVMDKRASITLGDVEMDPGAFQKLMTFRQHVLQSHVCGMFCDLPDLRMKMERALREYQGTTPSTE